MIFTSAERSADAEASRRSFAEGDEYMSVEGETGEADVAGTLATGADTGAGGGVIVGRVMFGTTKAVEEVEVIAGCVYSTVTPPEKATIKAPTARAAAMPR